MPYILAVGAPTSEILPAKSGSLLSSLTSFRIDCSLRDDMNLPWCAAMVQKLQPPKHPRCVFTENLIISYAGMRLPLYRGCGSLVNGRSQKESISCCVAGGYGGLICTYPSPTGSRMVSGCIMLAWVSIQWKFSANARLSLQHSSKLCSKSFPEGVSVPEPMATLGRVRGRGPEPCIARCEWEGSRSDGSGTETPSGSLPLT